jgi:outer membrane protein assembly factor BamB
MWIALAVALVVVIVAATVIAIVLTSSSSSSGRPEGLLAGTYPQQPTAAWTITPESLGAATFWTPDTEAAYYGNTGFIDAGDTLIVRVLSKDMSAAKLVALDAKTGQQKWSIQADKTKGCSPEVIDRLLPCIIDGAVQFIKISDGSIASTYHPNSKLADVTSDGETVITAGYGRDYNELIVTSGTVQQPDSHWTMRVDTSDCSRFSSGDVVDLVARDGFVGLTIGGANGALRLSDGSQLVERARLWAVYPGLGAVAQPCVGMSGEGTPTGTYVGLDGQKLRVGDVPLAPAVWVTAMSKPPVLLGNGDAVDFATGARKWRVSGLKGSYGSFSVVGDVLAYMEGTSLNAYDMSNGKQRWSREAPSGWRPAVTDGARMVGYSSGAVSALSLADGSQVWTVRVQTEGSPGVGAASAGLVITTPNAIALYPPTGGPSHVPSNV